MKRIITALISVFMIATLSLFASATSPAQEIEYLEDGSFFVTMLENESSAHSLSSSTITQSKTKTYYSSSGVAQWYVKVTGTFTYGGGSSQCTSASVSAGSYVSNWSISSKSASKSGNKATATATAKQTRLGQAINTVTASVTLTCSSAGVFS